jgi:hypothetical protein
MSLPNIASLQMLSARAPTFLEEELMGKYEKFEVDFVTRSREIIDQYDLHVLPNVDANKQYEVTLLINCLLGLLVLPKERHLNKIPNVPLSNLNGWGIKSTHIIKPGKNCDGEQRQADTITLRQVVIDMRHSVAHILFETYGVGALIEDIEFRTDRSRFKAKMPVSEFRVFVQKIAEVVTDRGTGA